MKWLGGPATTLLVLAAGPGAAQRLPPGPLYVAERPVVPLDANRPRQRVGLLPGGGGLDRLTGRPCRGLCRGGAAAAVRRAAAGAAGA